MLNSQLTKKEKEINDMEINLSEALSSIHSFSHQQKQLFDEFVLLRQRYDEQKLSLINILWTQCAQYHAELQYIPIMENQETFKETETQVGKYSIGSLLGEGQFATVKECWLVDLDPTRAPADIEEESVWALKIIKKDRITSFNSLKRVSNEINILQILKSKFVVSIADVFQSLTRLYIVIEKGGADLFEFFDEHPDGVPAPWAKEIITCILRGVLYCHQQGICHRG